jgi:hypothetical protein
MVTAIHVVKPDDHAGHAVGQQHRLVDLELPSQVSITS